MASGSRHPLVVTELSLQVDGMCTAAWLRTEGKTRILFNRDEARGRELAKAPQAISSLSVQAVAPIDPPSGGTWIWINQHGLAGAILNRYREVNTEIGKSTPGRKSRGPLLLHLGVHKSLDTIQAELKASALHNYEPFIALFWNLDQVLGLTWDGQQLQELSLATGLVTTSSWQPEKVEPHRLSAFKACRDDFDRVKNWMSRQDIDRPALSPMMSRSDSRTMSQTEIMIESGRIEMEYHPVEEAEGKLVLQNAGSRWTL